MTPAPRHLFQLREKIYDKVHEHPQENDSPAGFIKINQINLAYILSISEAQQLQDLINMTPFAWKFNKSAMDKLLAEKHWSIECDFNIEVYQKK